MTAKPNRRWTLPLGLLLTTAAALPLARAKVGLASSSERYLYVWAGDVARKAPDFLAVVDFEETSAGYGRILKTVPLPAEGGTWNEPHHRSSADPPQSAITDEFYPLENGGFLVTMMGGAQGHHPGRVAEFDKDLKLVAEHPASPPEQGFNPHGISVRPEANLMVTSDFICPSSTLHAVPGDLVLRGSVRVWDFRARRIQRTIDLPGAGGTIDVRLIPRDKALRAFTAGMIDDRLYLIDTRQGTARPVFDFSAVAKGGWPQLMRMTSDGSRLFISLNVAGKVVMFDTSDPEAPRILKVLDLGKDAGPHYIALTRDEKRLVVTDYFLNEDEAGKVHAEGDHRIHVAKLTGDDLVLDRRFDLDFDTALPGGPARPHGVAFK